MLAGSTEDLAKNIAKELNDNLNQVVTFWLKYSVDEENGGYFNCLTDSGVVYDPSKHIWLQGRQVWFLCRLYLS